MSVVATPGARETFTPRELAEAYKAFVERGPQCLDAETGFKVSVYRFGGRVLLLYEEFEMGMVTLVDLTSPKKVRSQKFERGRWVRQRRIRARCNHW